jgi:hypothetical protein
MSGYVDRPRPHMRLVSFKPIAKGGLLGLATVELPSGLKLIDCAILRGQNGTWAALPSRPILDNAGRHAKPSGKGQYTPAAAWRDRDLQNRWSDSVIALIEARYPGTLL